MKKKLWLMISIVLAIVIIITVVLVVVLTGNDSNPENPNKPNEPNNPSTHTHSYADEWLSNDIYHWHKCIECDEISSKEEHTWNSGEVIGLPTCTTEGTKVFTCTTCGKTKTEKLEQTQHTFSNEWSSDATYHWYAATCSCENLIKDKGVHNFNLENKCEDCGYELEYTKDLLFAPCATPNESFYKVTGLKTDSTATEIIIPPYYNGRQVVEVGKNAFKDNKTITKVVLSEGLKLINMGAFFKCSSLAEVKFPDNYLYNISTFAFYGCPIKEIVLPKEIEGLGWQCFGEALITSIYLPKSIENFVTPFYCCELLKEVVFEEGFSAPISFYGNPALETLNLPESVTVIDEIDGLGIKELNIGKNVTEIGSNGLRYCNSLEKITVSELNPIYKSDQNCIIEKATNKVVKGCKTSVIPNYIETIGEYAFECSELISINIPSSVTLIEDNAFNGCNKLIEVRNYSTLNISLGSSTHGNVAKYAKIIITDPNNSSSLIATNDGFLFSFSENSNQYSLIDYQGGEKNLVLPNNINGSKYIIGDYAFQSKSIYSIVIPEGVTAIGDYAFNNSALRSINIGKDVISINMGYAFNNCHVLADIAVDIANPVYYSQDNCLIKKSDKTLILGAMNSIIPNDVTKIGKNAFWGRYGIESIVIPDSVKEIGEFAFAWCEDLDHIVLGKVEKIGFGAFNACNLLSDVYYHGTEAEFVAKKYYEGTGAVQGQDEFASAYKWWYTEKEPTDLNNYWHYDENNNVVKWPFVQ